MDVIISSVVVLVIGVAIVYLLSKALKLRPKPIAIAAPRKEMPLVFLVIVAAFAVMSVLSGFLLDVLPPTDVIDVLWVVFIYALLLLPLVIAMRRTGQAFGSIGISRKDSWRTFALGLILSAVSTMLMGFTAPSYGGSFIGFSPTLAYGLVIFAINGSSEEIVFRGYIQTRLIAYSGTLKGLMVTSLVFALWHFPISYYASSGAVLESLANALLRWPLGLLLGYIMLKSQNIIPSSIYHALWNWSLLLWQMPYGFD
jgi:membrane protease YdiL (CAAX protease family)